MDTVKKYQEIIINLLSDFTSKGLANPGLEKQLIADNERNRFQVIVFGWENRDKLVNSVLIHLEIKDGKIWIQQNWTEVEIAKELMDKGVPKSDIVLVFLPEYMRADTEFEVA